MLELPILFFGAFICGVIGMLIGSSKDRGGMGFFLGLMLGPIGWIIVLLLPSESRQRGDVGAAPPLRIPPVLPPQVNPTTMLLDLKKLLDAQVITQAEFDAKKKILLDQIGKTPASAPQSSAVQYRIPGLND